MAGEFAPWADRDAQPLVRFENVTKRFGDFVAIRNLSVDIYEREFFALLGPSGCGKTTLMRMLAGFESASEGRVLLAGQDLAGVPPNRRPVNMMFQSYALFPHMSVAKNIGFGLAREGKPKAEIRARVDEMLALTQLEPFANRKPHQLSGGQRQRVALARSLAKRPRLVLLDEPLAALDKKLREETQFELMNIQESIGVTFIIVTHDQEEAMTVASRIAVMQGGELEQVSPPIELYERPNSRYVADFVGDANILQGNVATMSEGVAGLAWKENEPNLKVSDRGVAVPAVASTAWLSVRPEKVEISHDRPAGADNAVSGHVWDIAYTGSTSTYHVRLDDGTIVKSREVNQHSVADRRFTWEDSVWLHWPAAAGVLLTR
ncbi:MAG: polyamine ABC transporter ATP-binding protein [Gammaproteobacteria bacterium]|nr:polyamine ABC transporter ATP-binding protein [Gammaproteobacteria bacterium]